MAIAGFLTILVFLAAIISKRMSVITALVLIPIGAALLVGIPVKELGPMILDGIKQVAPTGIMLIFAVLYFAIMLDVGLFDPVIHRLLKIVGGDPKKVLIGTAILTMLVHLDGDGTATFMIVISAFLPLYERLQIKKFYLAGIVALGVGPIHLVPWSGTSARAISTLQTDATHIFNPNLWAILGGVIWVLFVAYYWGKKEQTRLGIQQVHVDEVIDSTETAAMKRPKLLVFNAILTIGLIIVLIKGFWPTPVLFLVGAMIALIVNYPVLADQSKVLKSHGGNIFSVSSMIFAAGVFSGILTGSKMIEFMAEAMVSAVPAEHASLIPALTALTSVPASLLFTPDAYYFGVVPVLAKTMVSFGLDPLQIGRAALLGQMTVGFPLSPLTASTFLLISLTKVELGEHQKNVFLWAVGTSVVMTLVAILTGSISV